MEQLNLIFMKKLFISLCMVVVTTASFAANKTIKNNYSTATEKEVVNSGVCAIQIGNQIFITSARCFLCGDKRTETRCKRKLKKLVEALLEVEVIFE